MTDQPTQLFVRLSEDSRVDVLLLVLLLSGIAVAGSTYRSELHSLSIAGWTLAAIALAVSGAIELGAAIAELRRHPESFESADRTVSIWMYLMDRRHGTVGFTGLALIAAGILGEAIRVPDALQLLTLVLGGLLAGLGAYHPLLAPETDEFFEDDAVDD